MSSTLLKFSWERLYVGLTLLAYRYCLWQAWQLWQLLKVYLKSQNSRNQDFSYYFCLMTEGSGSGSIPLTNKSGSGSRRPKNLRIQRIRIHNTVFISSTLMKILLRASLVCVGWPCWRTACGKPGSCVAEGSGCPPSGRMFRLSPLSSPPYSTTHPHHSSTSKIKLKLKRRVELRISPPSLTLELLFNK